MHLGQVLDEQDEKSGVSIIDWDEHAIKFSTATVFVFSDLVLCFGDRMVEYSESGNS